MKKLIIYLILAAVLVLSGALLYRSCTAKPAENTILLSASSDAKEIVRLTALEGDQVVPVTFRKGGIGAFGIGYYRTRIYFDVEQMAHAIVGDTLYLRLPEPQVQILEEQQQGFHVLDVWGENILTRLQGPQLSVEDENQMKAKAIKTLRAQLLRDGSLDRAKTQATEMIHKMFSLIPGTVILLDYTDPLPEGDRPIDSYRPLDQ
ncbi:hypothetical protein IX335_001140 [Porphyromonas levii]|uniref:DUF4230 domain-containing protein n=1 Tax=Porphyromonas levii TaxID=28114 RepID=UPI001BA4CC39|nr:DUF4230 domain-containing protein [Porphyromonas levii]MBR8763916.1 hypothetical protein [Porphyromonas levii]